MKFIKWLKELILFTPLVFSIISNCIAENTQIKKSSNKVFRDELRAEFNSAYPIDAPQADNEVTYELIAKPTAIKMIDGRKLNVWAYNGMVPGPVLRVKLGESIKVRLVNKLPQPTSIHWHGVRLPNAMDGVPGVTQAAVMPGKTFTYRFTPKDAGTFWFHPHYRTSEQVERGLQGALIVEDTNKFPYDRDILWVLDDWRLASNGQIDPNFNTRHDLAHDGRWGGVVTVNGKKEPQFKLKPGERVRLRLLNTANARVFRPELTVVKASIIAVDGLYTKYPIPFKDFELVPGGRVDLDFTVPVNLNNKSFQLQDRFTRQKFTIAKFFVKGEKVLASNFNYPSNPFVPSWANGRALPIDKTFVLDAKSGGKYGITWMINGKAWGEQENLKLTINRWTKLRFQNDSFRIHPMHLHGQFFKVLTRNGMIVEEPFFRDTVLLKRKDVVDIALIPMDYGKWMMHCHILEHAQAGMMTLVEVK